MLIGFVWLGVIGLLSFVQLDCLWRAFAFASDDSQLVTPRSPWGHFWGRFLRLFRWRSATWILMLAIMCLGSLVRPIGSDGKAGEVPVWFDLLQLSVPIMPLGAQWMVGFAWAAVLLPRRWSWGLFVGLGTFLVPLISLGTCLLCYFGLPQDWHVVVWQTAAGGVATSWAFLIAGLPLIAICAVVSVLARRRGAEYFRRS